MARDVGDDEIVVDRMIAASQKKGDVALPSYGRDLVPYFVGTSKEFTERDINVNTDVDALRRNGASYLEAPMPLSEGGLAPLPTSTRKSTSKVGSVNSRLQNGKADVGKKGRRGDRGRHVATVSALGHLLVREALHECEDVHFHPRHTSSPPPKGPPPFGKAARVIPVRVDFDTRDALIQTRMPSPELESSPSNYGSHNLASSPTGQELLSKSAPEGSGISFLEASHGKKLRKPRPHKPVPMAPASGTSPPSAEVLVKTAPRTPEPSPLDHGSMLWTPLMFEKWAGPGYTNSPPPSSLPLPKFSSKVGLQTNVSLKTPVTAGEEARMSMAPRSAPSSPLHEPLRSDMVTTTPRSNGLEALHLETAAAASNALRRMLNLNMETWSHARKDEGFAGSSDIAATTGLKRLLQLQ